MPACLAAASCVPSCEPSMAPMTRTFAPFSIMAGDLVLLLGDATVGELHAAA